MNTPPLTLPIINTLIAETDSKLATIKKYTRDIENHLDLTKKILENLVAMDLPIKELVSLREKERQTLFKYERHLSQLFEKEQFFLKARKNFENLCLNCDVDNSLAH